MFSDRLLAVLTTVLFITGGATIGYVFFGEKVVKLTNEFNFNIGRMDCVDQKLKMSVADEFMTGLMDRGTPYVLLKNYYSCNKVSRGDIVSLRISGPLEPVVKVVRGIGGDTFEVIPDREGNNRYFIKVNGDYVTDRTGRFIIETSGKPALQTYHESRSGVIREDELLILSNVSPGKSDSASLGLVKQSLIEGKVVLDN